MFTPFISHVQQKAANAAVHGLQLTHHLRNHQLSRGEKLMLGFFLATAPETVFGQGGGGGRAVGAMRGFANTAIQMIQIAFIIVLGYGVFNCVRKFITQDQGAFGALATLLVGLLVWFSFNYFQEDIRAAMGGGSGGVTITP
jgi:hypothetical protein